MVNQRDSAVEPRRRRQLAAADERAAFHPLLGLQQAAGNAAVNTLLGGAASAPGLAVQRCGGPEHEELGHDTGARDVDLGNGVVLTWGQVVAIAGDEYPDIATLRQDAATDEGKRRIRAALEHAGVAGAGGSPLPEPTDAEAREHLKDYQLLALSNRSHFAGEGNSIAAWQDHHTEALIEALQAGVDGRAERMSGALATEAFGEHFLTDSFSGGHVRVPRGSIIDWYMGTFAPRVSAQLVAELKQRLVADLFAQAKPQIPWYVPDSTVRSKIESKVNAKIDKKIADIGGMTVLANWVGLAVAGAVSGSLHDMEGERGVWVTSKAHSEPFQAFGDSMLDKPENAVNRAQALLAMRTAQEDLNIAFRTGESEGAASAITGAEVPSVVYFGFDSSALDPRATALLATASAYLVRHPEAHADVTGHTDPLGATAYNDGLGMRRAEAVAAALTRDGATPDQVTPASAGESQLVAADPKHYNLDRRAAIAWTTRPVTDTHADTPFNRAQAALQSQVGPPYQRVEDLIPHPVPEGAGHANPVLEDWKWGSMPRNLVDRVDAYVNAHVTKSDLSGVLATSDLDDITESGITVKPRDAAERVLGALLAKPMDFLGTAFGQKPGG